MPHTFADAFAIVLREEGGYVNDRKDPGGMTNLGVTALAWRDWTGRPVTKSIMRGLTRNDVQPFYKAMYWDKVGGDTLPPALALVLFDYAVNSGPARAIRNLQSVVGASRDGQIGPATMRAMQAYVTGIGLAKLITRFCDAHRDFYREQDNFLHFGKGWLARVDDIQKVALSWL